ncbi:hypothetical protein Y032_0008g260 [Ancylostoma ceylanicum]|uniref:Uncharacterized protein n=1 Tax=Ancylostoma ceylanicum TaxID=53326 RepID=A0A016VLP5_9BILA|nr:hypothetical protein Y032_0008g260 [Ancylostoma ceylanicum]
MHSAVFLLAFFVLITQRSSASFFHGGSNGASFLQGGSNGGSQMGGQGAPTFVHAPVMYSAPLMAAAPVSTAVRYDMSSPRSGIRNLVGSYGGEQGHHSHIMLELPFRRARARKLAARRAARMRKNLKKYNKVMSINPYAHTSYIKNPTVGRKLFADEVHQDMMGIANQFTATPTINKYAHSTESIADIANLPAVVCSPFTRASSTKKDNETINKRKLTTDSIYDLHQIPCPFGGPQGKEEHGEGRKRRFFSEESRHDLSMLPDPFQTPRSDRSDYVFDRTYNPRPVQNQSHYAFDYPLPSPLPYVDTPPNESRWQERDQKTMNKYVRSAQSQVDLQRVPALSYHNYHSYRSPANRTPTHSSYDYTPYAQPMMPPPAPVYMPLPPMQANPYLFHPPAYAYYPYAHYAPMYHLGPPAYYTPYPAPFYPSTQSSDESDVRTEVDHARIPDQFYNNPQKYNLHRPVTPDNETINKHLRGAESIADLHKLEVNFEPRPVQPVQNPSTPVTSSSNGGYRFRDFSVDSIKDLDALPPISQISLYNTPTRNVITAKSISDRDVSAGHPVAARST